MRSMRCDQWERKVAVGGRDVAASGLTETTLAELKLRWV
jgi:hypothetical protein